MWNPFIEINFKVKKIYSFFFVIENNSSSNLPITPFVYTKTSESNMISLALAVSQGKPILLQGVTGSGKTALIDELSLLLGYDNGDYHTIL